MEKLEKIWELISAFFTGILGGFERLVTRIFGSSNEKMVKKLQEKVEIEEKANYGIMTYTDAGRQYVILQTGPTLTAVALPSDDDGNMDAH